MTDRQDRQGAILSRQLQQALETIVVERTDEGPYSSSCLQDPAEFGFLLAYRSGQPIHVLDWGYGGLAQTLKSLHRSGIATLVLTLIHPAVADGITP